MKSPALLILLLLASHPRAIAQQEAPAAARELPQAVGNLGKARNLRFAGNHSFPDDVLRKALAKDLSFVLASHSEERLDAFLPVIAGRLRLGYLNSGFPTAQARVTHQPGNGEGTLLVTIEEGPRYRQGEIRITGGAGIDPLRLAEDLKTTPEEQPKSSQVATIRAALAPRAASLPPPLAPAPGAPATDVPQTLPGLEFLNPGNSSSSQEADWQPGKPVEFEEGNKPPLEDRIRYRLAEQGRPLARFTSSHELQPGCTADLRIDITDAGPEARIGTVQVSGAQRNTEAEIRRAAGLEEGRDFLPHQLDEAMLALWRTGRFMAFEIDMRPRGGTSREIDFHIRVCELEKVPPLSTPATAEQQCALRFIDWINRGMDGGDLVLEFTEPGTGTITAGWSHQDGMFLSGRTEATGHGLSLSQSAKGLSLMVRDGDEVLPAQLDLPLGNFRGWCHILGENDPQPMSISFGVGFSSLGAKTGSLQSLKLLITPAYVFLKENEITRDGDSVVIKDLLRLDAATGRLIGIRGGSARTAAGSVRELQEALDRQIHAVKPAVGAVDWIDALSALAKIEEIADDIPDSVHSHLASARDIARLMDLVGGSGVLAPLLDTLLGKDGEDGSGDDDFFIPTDPAEFQQAGMLGLLVGAGSVSVVEDLLPDVEWASTFSRELLFMAGGRNGHTRQVMNGLLKDPAIGPVGSLLCSGVLDMLDPGLAERFLIKAGDQASAEAFRRDWRMLLGSGTPLGESLERAVASLAAFGPDKEAEAAALLPPRLSAWLHDFLGALRRRPADQTLADWIEPSMDRLWNDHLGAMLRQSLEGKIPPPADPKEVAATVDGVPVSRVLLRLLRDQNRAALSDFPLPAADEARPWTRDPVLAAAIRGTLGVEEMRRQGRISPDEAIQAHLDKVFPDLAGKEDGDWIRKTGLTRQQLRNSALLIGTQQLLRQEFAAAVPEPEEKLLRDHFKARLELFRGNFTTSLVWVKPANPGPRELALCHRLAASIANLAENGMPLVVVDQFNEEEAESRFATFTHSGATADSLQLPILQALERLREGQVSESMELGTGIAVVMLRSRKEDPAIEFDQVKEIVAEHWKRQQADAIADRWFAAREADADIRLVGPADGPVDGPADSSAFGDLLAGQPDSRVGLLGDFWVKLNAGDPPATDAAWQRLLAAGWKDAGKLVFLVEPLANKSRRDLALACIQKASTANPEMTRSYLDAMVEQHAGHGCELGTWLKDQRDRLPKVDADNR